MSARTTSRLAGADIDGLIAASTAANARVARLQQLADTIVADMRQAAERRLERLELEEQLLADHEAFGIALENAAGALLGDLMHEADEEAAAASRAADDAVAEAEERQPAFFPCAAGALQP